MPIVKCETLPPDTRFPRAVTPLMHALRHGRLSAERERFPKRGMCNDFHSRHSLSAGGPPSALACGVSLGHAFPAGVSYLTFQSTGTSFLRNIVGKLALLLQFVYSPAVPSIFRQKEVSNCSRPNQDFKSKLVYSSCFFTIILND